MAFCTKCGKQLQEGEVCACQQSVQNPNAQPAPAQPAPASPGTSGVFVMEIYETISGLIKKPVDTAQAYVKKGSFPMAALLIGLVMLIEALFKMFNKMKQPTSAEDWLGLLNSSLSGSGKLNYFLTFVNGVVDVAVAAALVALIYMILVQAIGGGKITYVQGLCIVSLSLVWSIVATPAAFLIGLIPVKFFVQLSGWIKIFASAMGTVYLIEGVKSVVQKKNMLPYIIACAMVVNAVSTWLVMLMFQQ